jgi:hypothetical protein
MPFNTPKDFKYFAYGEFSGQGAKNIYIYIYIYIQNEPTHLAITGTRCVSIEGDIYPPAVAWAVWSGRCWLRVHCHCAALLVLC